MLFILLLSLITTSIAGAAAFFSIYGLAQIFSGTFWAVVFMGASLEAGKLVAASFLYRYWSKISFVLKTYLTVAVIVLMFITSMGIFGFLSQSYQKDSLPLKEMQVKIDGLKQEQATLLARKQAIDTARQDAVSAAVNNQSTKSRVVRSKERLARTYDTEIKDINKRLPVLTKEIQDLDTQVLTTQLHTGPITYIAKALGREIDDATKWVIFMLISAFDPLAVALTIGVNIAVNIRKKEFEQAKQIAFEKERQDKLEQIERERQERIDEREEARLRRTEELEEAKSKLLHETEIASLQRQYAKIVTGDEVIESFDSVTTPVKESVEPIPQTLQTETVVDPDTSAIDDLRRVLDTITAKKEPTPEELTTKQQIESILSRRQLLDNMRGGSLSE